MIVVSDTSPIRALAHLGLIDLLGTLYKQIIVPAAVERELKNPPPPLPTVDLKPYSFFQVRAQAAWPKYCSSLAWMLVRLPHSRSHSRFKRTLC